MFIRIKHSDACFGLNPALCMVCKIMNNTKISLEKMYCSHEDSFSLLKAKTLFIFKNKNENILNLTDNNFFSMVTSMEFWWYFDRIYWENKIKRFLQYLFAKKQKFTKIYSPIWVLRKIISPIFVSVLYPIIDYDMINNVTFYEDGTIEWYKDHVLLTDEAHL